MAFTFRSVGRFLGKAAKVAAPVVGMVNPALGIGLGALGGLGNGKDSLKQMAGGAVAGGAGALAGRAGGAAGAGGGTGFMDRARGALDKIGGVDTLIGAASAYDGYRADREANKYRKMAMDHARQQWDANAPLREAGMRDLMDETQPDLSGLYGASENPFRRVRRSY